MRAALDQDDSRPLQLLADGLQNRASAELTRDILSQRQLEAVMTDFWANHFNVFASKGFVRLFEGDYLERAIRPRTPPRTEEPCPPTSCSRR